MAATEAPLALVGDTHPLRSRVATGLPELPQSYGISIQAFYRAGSPDSAIHPVRTVLATVAVVAASAAIMFGFMGWFASTPAEGAPVAAPQKIVARVRMAPETIVVRLDVETLIQEHESLIAGQLARIP
jgi:hypothetical protein